MLTGLVFDLPFMFVELAHGIGADKWPSATTLGVPTPWATRWYGNLVKDYALYMVKMSARSFTGVGTITVDPQSNDVMVGPLIQPNMNLIHPAQLDVYSTSAECHIARLDHLLHLVGEGLKGWNTGPGFLKKAGRDPVWLYLCLLEARELVVGCKEMNTPQPTYLRHTDDHPDQFFATADGHISALIDWE
jgi:hypothetical protein